MLATVTAATLLGVRGHHVTVEAHVGQGLPAFAIVGLPDAACREARDRVRAATMSAGATFPNRKITVNLAPSALPKVGTGLDLAVAIALLVATEQVPAEAVAGWAYLGELGLDGSVRPVRGVVPLVASLRDAGVRGVVVPTGVAADAALVPGLHVRAAPALADLVAALRAEAPWPDVPAPAPPVPDHVPDLADVRGQALARRVVEVAAAGGHHLLLSGPPGAGKTLLATRLPGLLPALDDDAALEVTAIWSAAGESVPGRLHRRPPLRSPHHSASMVSITGGGTASMRPGEISLSHHGVLFLDELGEFPPTVLDALRQPLEDGLIRVTRARGAVTYPARFQLVAATNPCPCGLGGLACTCTEAARLRYRRRLSGPLLDRFDLRIDVHRPDPAELVDPAPGEPTSVVAGRVAAARARAHDRGVGTNASIPGWRLDRDAPVDAEARRLLEASVRAGRLSGRGVHRVRRVARTLADLDSHDGPLGAEQVALALAMRCDLSVSEVAA